MSFNLLPLPYRYPDLEPHISASTLALHYDKHYRGYVDRVNQLAGRGQFGRCSLEQLMVRTAGDEAHRALFQNAAQAWNHAFYWCSLHPGGGGEPHGEIADRIRRAFGDHGAFVERFSAAATGQFGSGWAWLVLDGDSLAITQTSNADTPFLRNQIPLLTIDVWEHAYYLDYQNRRAEYVGAVIDRLLNWDFANGNLLAARNSSISEQDVQELCENA